jgi:dTDP-4-dehydrorhamnose 3,5-epimerase-like enzyme
MSVNLIKGDISIDDRGSVSFVNDFNFSDIKRSYVVKNHRNGFIRAWHGHKKEAKYVQVITGAAVVAAVYIDNWINPSPDLQVNRFILSENKPSILYIPPGYANGFKTLLEGTSLIFFSTSTLKESGDDDFRFDYNFWNPWDENYR